MFAFAVRGLDRREMAYVFDVKKLVGTIAGGTAAYAAGGRLFVIGDGSERYEIDFA